MKKIILTAWLTILLWITNADFLGTTYWTYEFEVWQPEVLWEYTYVFDSRWSFTTNDFPIAYKQYHANTTYYSVQYAWKDGKLYYRNHATANWWEITQWFIDKWCISSNYDDCKDGHNSNYNKTTEEWTSNNPTITKVRFWQESTARDRAYGNRPIKICFYDNVRYYCASCAHNIDCPSWLTGESLNLTMSNVQEYERDRSPIVNAWMIAQKSCPTIKEVEETYGINKNICYAWYDENIIYTQGETTTITPGQWLTLFETRQITSWWMNIQTWYDTYREYYQNAQSNIRAFENKPKALLGAQTVRQMYGKNKSSYTILNYCNVALYTGDKNATTCTTAPGNFQLPIEEAQPTTQEILESLVSNTPSIITPGTWTVFKQILWEQGNRKIRASFESIYWKLTNLFHFRQGVQWIIPIYITWIILIIVLLKVFRK